MILFLILILLFLYISFKVLKFIFNFIALREKMSIKILSNFFHLYSFLMQLEKYQSKFIEQEKKWSNYYIINRILYYILSIISFFIFCLGFLFHLFNLQLYIFVIYRFLNYLYLNYYYFFFNFNFFIKFLILIFFCIYLIFISYILYFVFFKKIYIYLYVFFKFFTCQGTSNIFSIFSNQIILNYFNNTNLIKRFIDQKLNKIFLNTSLLFLLQPIAQSIYFKWKFIYKQSFLIKIIIIISFIIKFLLKLMLYCFLINIVYNLFDLSYPLLLIFLGQIQNEILNSSNMLEQLFLIIKYINLKLYLFIYLSCIKIYEHHLFLGLPSIIPSIFYFILPIYNTSYFKVKTIQNNNFEVLNFEVLKNNILPVIEKFNMYFYQYEYIANILLMILSLLFFLLIIFFILKLFLKLFFLYYYYQQYNIKTMILKISSIKLLKPSRYALYLKLQKDKFNYFYGYDTLFKNYIINTQNDYSKDNQFNLEFSHKLLNLLILTFLFSEYDLKKYKKYKQIKKIKKARQISGIIIGKIITMKPYVKSNNELFEKKLLDKNFFIKNKKIKKNN